MKVSDGPGEDLRHQLVANVAEARWEGFTDLHGIVQYEHYLSASAICSGAAPSGLPSPRTTTQTTARLTGLSLSDNKSYFHCVRAKDGAGNWSPHVSSDGFRVDLSPPAVSGTTPATGSSEVDILAPVRFTFNEPVDASSLTPGSLTLEVNGAPVETTVACTASVTSCAFTPVSPLPYRETVRATLSATVKDTAGRVMTSPVSLTFTTRGRVWQAPREVRSMRPGLFPDVAVDGQGQSLAVWVQGTASGAYRPFASRSTPYGGWEPARELDTVHPGDVERPAVAVNEAGFGVAVWELHGARVDLYAAEYTPGTGWGEPRLLDTRAEPVSTPRVGVDAEGNALVVWRQSDGTAESLWAARLVKGGGWGAPLLLEPDAGATTVPALALEGSGRAVAAWLQPDTGGTVRVRASRYVPGSGWTPPEQAAASGEGTSVSAALSANGSAFLLFRGSSEAGPSASLLSTRFVPGEGWSTAPTRLGDAPPGGDDPALALDRWGRAMAVWTRPSSTFDSWVLSVSRFVPEEGWRSIPLGTRMASQPAVASDGQGNFHLVWVENTYGIDQVFAARYPEGATAINSLVEMEPYHGGTSKRPRVRANGTGAAMTVWYRDNGGGFSSNLVYAAAYE
ncbi:Ig-like domain-containing protein [Archangium gephyra]|uniref:Ig-like domain-containing protein n=1 Tax=Archangium gephyra TaxID=48 RepID=UPI003B7C0EEE